MGTSSRTVRAAWGIADGRGESGRLVDGVVSPWSFGQTDRAPVDHQGDTGGVDTLPSRARSPSTLTRPAATAGPASGVTPTPAVARTSGSSPQASPVLGWPPASASAPVLDLSAPDCRSPRPPPRASSVRLIAAAASRTGAPSRLVTPNRSRNSKPVPCRKGRPGDPPRPSSTTRRRCRSARIVYSESTPPDPLDDGQGDGLAIGHDRKVSRAVADGEQTQADVVAGRGSGLGACRELHPVIGDHEAKSPASSGSFRGHPDGRRRCLDRPRPAPRSRAARGVAPRRTAVPRAPPRSARRAAARRAGLRRSCRPLRECLPPSAAEPGAPATGGQVVAQGTSCSRVTSRRLTSSSIAEGHRDDHSIADPTQQDLEDTEPAPPEPVGWCRPVPRASSSAPGPREAAPGVGRRAGSRSRLPRQDRRIEGRSRRRRRSRRGPRPRSLLAPAGRVGGHCRAGPRGWLRRPGRLGRGAAGPAALPRGPRPGQGPGGQLLRRSRQQSAALDEDELAGHGHEGRDVADPIDGEGSQGVEIRLRERAQGHRR